MIVSLIVIILACAIALSSTAVAIKMLERIDELRTNTGRIAIGVLIAQDLAIVPIILIIRGMGGGGFNNLVLIKVGISIAILLAMILFFGRKKSVRLPFSKTIEQNPDLTPLAALVFCFGSAFISGSIDLSAAYGAFLGGLILGNTTERHTMVKATKPIQSVLMMVFFLSIGLLMDLSYIWHNLGKVLILLAFITIGKTFINVSILHLLKQPWPRAFLAGVILAQMGEFSFLLAQIGTEVKLLTDDGHKLIISLAVLSLAISPFWMATARRLHELAPVRIKTFKQLLSLIWGREIDAISTVVKTAVKTYKKTNNNDKGDDHFPEDTSSAA